MNSGYVGIDKDYFVSAKEVLNITAETGAWETQTRVRKLLPADVVRVRHGHWINDTSYAGWTCSECGDHEGNKTDKYCHNCGAKMDKEQEHE